MQTSLGDGLLTEPQINQKSSCLSLVLNAGDGRVSEGCIETAAYLTNGERLRQSASEFLRGALTCLLAYSLGDGLLTERQIERRSR